MRLEGIGAAPLKAGIHSVTEAAKRHDNSLLSFLHDEKPTAQPDQRNQTGNQACTNTGTLGVRCETTPLAAGTLTFVAGENAAEFAVEIAPEFIEIRRTILATAVSDLRTSKTRNGLLDGTGRHPGQTSSGAHQQTGCQGHGIHHPVTVWCGALALIQRWHVHDRSVGNSGGVPSDTGSWGALCMSNRGSR